MRERFISTLESAYYFRPLEGAIVLRSYPSPWLVYLEKENLENENEYELIAQEAQKPLGENLERIIQKALTPEDNQPGNQPIRKKPGILANLQSFLRALSQ